MDKTFIYLHCEHMYYVAMSLILNDYMRIGYIENYYFL